MRQCSGISNLRRSERWQRVPEGIYCDGARPRKALTALSERIRFRTSNTKTSTSNEVTKKDLDAVKKDLAAAKKTIDSLDGQVFSLSKDMKQAKADISQNWKVLYA